MKDRHTALFAAADSETPAPSAGGSGGSQVTPSLTLGAQLKSFLKDKATLQGEIDRTKAGLQAANDKVTDLEGKLRAVEAERDQLRTDMAEVKNALETAQREASDLAAKEQGIDKRASAQAKVIVQGAGIEAGKLPAATSDNMQPRTLAELQAEYGKIEDAAKAAEFYAAHIAPLFVR